MSYNTKQKEKILDIIKKEKHEFTVKDIYLKLGANIGLTTIYRLVDKLVSEGRVSKTLGKDNNTYYHYLEECNNTNHFYLKCDKCGTIEHVDCECIEDLTNHILKTHGFSAEREHIIINGVCQKCTEKKN